jgi:hypothetical protein
MCNFTCVTDFASIPALEIPQWEIPLDLEVSVGDLIRQGRQVACDHQAYF